MKNKFCIGVISIAVIASMLTGCSNPTSSNAREDMRSEEEQYFAEMTGNSNNVEGISSIGNSIEGYIDLSTGTWLNVEVENFDDASIKDSTQAVSQSSYSVITMITYNTGSSKSDLESESASYMHSKGGENIQGTIVSFGGDEEARQISGFFPNSLKYLVIWYFEPGDGYVHSVAAEFIEEEYYTYGLCEGYYLNESSKTSLTPSNEDLTDVEVSFEYSDGDLSSPADINEWIKASTFCIADGKYHTIYFRITNVESGDAVTESIDSYNNEGRYNTINPVSDDSLEYRYCDYEIYFPEDFPERDYGLTNNFITFTICNEEGTGMFDGYFGLTPTWDIGPRAEEIRPGETYTGRFIFAMIKNYNKFYVKYSTYKDQSSHNYYVDPT